MGMPPLRFARQAFFRCGSGVKFHVHSGRRLYRCGYRAQEEPHAGIQAPDLEGAWLKLALDPQMFYSGSSVYELPDIVASLGYDWMELSPKADFVPFFKYPRIDDAGVKRLKKLASDAGVGIASVLPVLRWSGPDEDQRQAAVRAWKRVIQITVDLGVDVINSEFNGRPESPETLRLNSEVDGRTADLRAGGSAADHRAAS